MLAALRLPVVVAMAVCIFCRPASADDAPIAEDFCGPTSVVEIAQSYGIDLSLQQILSTRTRSDLPWSLQDVADALKHFRIFAKCVRTENLRTIDWPWPVVLHLDRPPETRLERSAFGHFVVLFPEPPDPRRPILDGTGWYAFDDVADRVSGAAILTAPSYAAFLTQIAPHYAVAVLSSVTLVGIAVFATRSWKNKRKNSVQIHLT